jgi:hypothetical protein
VAMQSHIGGNTVVGGFQKLQMPVNVADGVNVHGLSRMAVRAAPIGEAVPRGKRSLCSDEGLEIRAPANGFAGAA